MKKRLIAVSSVLIASLALSACSESGGGTENVTTAAPSTMAQEAQSQVEEIKAKEFELKNKEITFLASWARNPAQGKNKDVAIELFQSKYGGVIKDKVVADADRYDQLATLVSTGDSPDFFSAADMDAFPMGAKGGMFQPIDNYIDFTDEWFSSRKALNDKFIYKGKHYVAAINPEVDTLMVYNRAIMAQNGFEDPYDLLKANKWNWDTCLDMMEQFCSQGDDYYATDGWWITKGFCNSTGVPFIGLEDGKVTNNLRSAEIAKAQELLQKLNVEKMAYPVWDHGWVSNSRNVGLGKTLFYPVGYWALTEVETEYGLKNYADDVANIGFVPVPSPTSDTIYIPARVTGYLLVSGAKNPEGYQCMMYCEAAANDSDEAEQITKDQYFNEYGWSEDMWEMRETMYDLLDKNPVFDFYLGISIEMKEYLDDPSKKAYHQGESWTSTMESIYNFVQSEVDKANENA